jgi:serine/threonine protein kinase
MTSLRHPNVAAAYDFEPVQGTTDYIFTMEYVEGQDGSRATEGAPWTTVVDLLVQICRALSYLHSRNLIHFDVKPSNLMVDGHGRAKLLDFGLSSARHATGQMRHRGTPHYMAPELARLDAPVDHRVDLYALGMRTTASRSTTTTTASSTRIPRARPPLASTPTAGSSAGTRGSTTPRPRRWSPPTARATSPRSS